ncbi:enoyl-CoA hydratase/isomerase family protein [Moritella sp. F3]|uniref:enoyl-CoA hydratase/isomerase family protein n=1 Tax=Moritella sp. F3 TaxID=2718882 RepID=UPI0018E12121|nr:enoyl-CoA hydratase/isomerase family protein [Moritella sp. F3]GIC76451.1 enoyl-CoA hydratase [Moritella sp. F1]GIC80880.1 enoyl-CoA hydratase [Moritella sp. F3]
MEASVLFDELATDDGHVIGIITLNKPRQLHALSADMFPLLRQQLFAWQDDKRIVSVLLTSTGERAFCAGGDVKSLQQALVNTDGNEAKQQIVSDYFIAEYQVDYLLHNFGKPLIVWGDGIIMGGGLGLFMGASHRVVTETARIAMPEITIGLFPDVGATWFLNRLPHPGVGLFLGLTGASINANDAKYLGLSEYLIPAAKYAVVIKALTSLDWQYDPELHHHQVDKLLTAQYAEADFAAGNLAQHQALFTQLSAYTELADVMTCIQMQDSADTWLQTSIKKLLSGSPISAHILYRQVNQYRDLSLAACFQLELDLAVKVCLNADLVEGVRALLVDKDNQPHWLYQETDTVPVNFVDNLFSSPWTVENHPLRML